MEQKSLRELAYLFIDNEMEQDMYVAFRERVSHCPDCQRETRSARMLVTVVRERCARQPAPTQLRRRVLAILPHRRHDD